MAKRSKPDIKPINGSFNDILLAAVKPDFSPKKKAKKAPKKSRNKGK